MDVCAEPRGAVFLEDFNRTAAEYSVVIKLAVEHAASLWDAAAARCRAETELSDDEIDETIGPRADPSISDCLALIAFPGPIAGCRILDFKV